MSKTIQGKGSLKIVFILGSAVLFYLTILSYKRIKDMNEAIEWVNHTNTVKYELEKSFSHIKDAESAQRGYLLSQDSAFLKEVAPAIAASLSAFDSLKILIADNTTQQSNLVVLRSHAIRRFSIISQAIKLAEKGAVPVYKLREGKMEMDKARRQVDKMIKEENRLLIIRTQNLNHEQRVTPMLTFLLIAGAIIMLFVSYFKINNSLLHARKLQAELEERARELNIVNLSLLENNEKLLSLNKELETFNYISSHDLQEPLRTISNYVGLFQSKYKGKLDEKTDRYLDFIIGAASRMQTLITDLLNYSRIGGKKQTETLDCNLIVNEILTEMAVSIHESNAKIKLGPLPVITGYPDIKSLFQNLLTNAIKFRKTDVPIVVSVKANDLGKEWQFSVQDNGIGIEKQYFNKLFVIFQRLHNQGDVSGTGIGLAQCKKIVEMHGGKIWIESEIGRGSTFYFTIQKELHDKEKD